MAHKIRGRSDKHLKAFVKALGKYESEHPRAQIEVYRTNNCCIRVRIIDPDFDGVDRVERDNTVRQLLEELPEETLSQLYLLILLAPKEKKKSIASMDFDSRIPSKV